jgi:hypothetical protein
LVDTRKEVLIMNFISGSNELAHYGVLGMKWGKRRSSASLDSLKKSYDKSAKANLRKADRAGAYAYLRTNADGKVSNNASWSTKQKVATANAKKDFYTERATRQQNIAKGIEKAKKLVEGMDMKQSIATLQDKAGYSKGWKVASKFLMSQKGRLAGAATDYALKITNAGKK